MSSSPSWGPSGSGKSSLLAVAGGLITPTSGTVTVDDTDLSTASKRELTRIRREHIGFVFQSGNLLDALTVEDQLRLPLTFGRVTDPPALPTSSSPTSACRTRPSVVPPTSSPEVSGSVWASPGH